MKVTLLSGLVCILDNSNTNIVLRGTIQDPLVIPNFTCLSPTDLFSSLHVRSTEKRKENVPRELYPVIFQLFLLLYKIDNLLWTACFCADKQEELHREHSMKYVLNVHSLLMYGRRFENPKTMGIIFETIFKKFGWLAKIPIRDHPLSFCTGTTVLHIPCNSNRYYAVVIPTLVLFISIVSLFPDNVSPFSTTSAGVLHVFSRLTLSINSVGQSSFSLLSNYMFRSLKDSRCVTWQFI